MAANPQELTDARKRLIEDLELSRSLKEAIEHPSGGNVTELENALEVAGQLLNQSLARFILAAQVAGIKLKR